MKGIEGLPLKYILIIIVAVIILGAFFFVLKQFASTTMAISGGYNQTLHEILNHSISRALK